MTPGRRPGGLTALAVINFVYAGYTLLTALGLVFILAMAGQLKEAMKTPEERALLEAFATTGMGVWAVLLISSLIALVLLLVAGVGYLKMRKWGRTAGNLFAVVSIVAGVVGAMMTPDILGGGFSISTIIGLVYPLLTLYFINVTFKDDLTTSR